MCHYLKIYAVAYLLAIVIWFQDPQRRSELHRLWLENVNKNAPVNTY